MMNANTTSDPDGTQPTDGVVRVALPPLVGRWQSLDSAPKDGTFILLLDRECGTHEGYRWNDCMWVGSKGNGAVFGLYEVTHWSPLLPSPNVPSEQPADENPNRSQADV